MPPGDSVHSHLLKSNDPYIPEWIVGCSGRGLGGGGVGDAKKALSDYANN